MDEKIDGEKNDRRYVIHKKDLYEQYHSALNSKDIQTHLMGKIFRANV